MLNAEQILKNEDNVKITKISVPEWGGEVGIKIMSGTLRDKYEAMVVSKTDSKGKILDTNGMKSFLLINTLCDEKGDLLFKWNQSNELNAKNGIVIDRLFKESLKINGMSEEGLEQAEKN